MAATVDQFGKALVASGLMTADEVKAVWSAIPADARPKQGDGFAKLLVQQGKLNPFQADELLAGRTAPLVMGDYVLLAKIGEGGMGQVFKAQHRRMNRVVALKVMSAAAMKDENAIKRFQREVHAAARLEHPNIVTAYDSGEAGNVKYLVMQFVDGGDLSELVKKNGPLEIERAVDYVLQTARGLAFAHGEGVIHRDIKPANLLLDKKGVVKILDMGLARIEGGDGLTATEQVMGTVDYMSPEQAGDTKHVDARADIYSLGCTLWFLLTGRKTYDGDSMIQRLMKHRNDPPPSLIKTRDDAPWALEQAFHKMIAKLPEERFQAMDEVVAALEPFAPSGGSRSGMGSSIGMGPQNAEMASFLKSVGPTVKPQTKPAPSKTNVNVEATAQFAAAGADTDPKSEILPPQKKVAKPQAKGSGKKPPPNKNLILAAAGGAALLVLLGVWFIFRDKDGNETARVQMPAGGSVTVQQTGPVGTKPAATPSATVSFFLPGMTSTGTPTFISPSTTIPTRWPLAASKLADIQWLVGLGAEVTLRTALPSVNSSIDQTIKSATEIPAGSATIVGIHFPGWCSRLTDADMTRIGNFINLESLSIVEADGKKASPHEITGQGWGRLAAIKHLRRLKVHGCRQVTVLPDFMSSLTALESLRLPYVDAGEWARAAAAAPALKEVDAYRTKLGDDGLARLEKRTSLLNIDLRDTLVSQPAIDRFAAAVPQCRIRTNLGGKEKEIAPRVPPPAPPSGTTTPPPGTPGLATAPFEAAQARAHQEAWAKHLGESVETTHALGMKFVLIPPGIFMMGEGGGRKAVELTLPFRLGVYEVTKEAWHAVMGTRPWKGDVRANSPAYWLSWDLAAEFCRKLTEQERAAGRLSAGWEYRLPTNAEWEFACRAGTTTKFSYGDDELQLGEYAWYDANATKVGEPYPHEVGRKKPNPWGLYDMHGNVWEFVATTAGNPQEPSETSRGKYRGGAFGSPAHSCRAANDPGFSPSHTSSDSGIRLALCRSGNATPPAAGPATTNAGGTNAAPPPAVPLSNGVVYLDDLPETKVQVYNFGKHGLDQAGKSIVWRGQQPAHSLFMHPLAENSQSEVSYALDGKFATFDTTVGLAIISQNRGSGVMTFRVLGDGRELWKSTPIQNGNDEAVCSVTVATVRELRLEAQCNGGTFNVNGVWIEPRLTPIGSTPSPVAPGNAAAPPPPAVAPFDAQTARSHQDAWARHLGIKVETPNRVGQTMILIPPGEFLIGSTDEQVETALKVADEIKAIPAAKDRIQKNERPQHKVVITKPFLMSATEVTVGQFKKFAAATSYQTEAEKGAQDAKTGTYLAAVSDDLPAAYITWNDATAYCQWLSTQEKTTYRLPTEAEWEYACRAGTTTQYSFGDDVALLNQYGWSKENAGNKSHPVGTKLPNGFGLFDMHGSLYECCGDYFDEKGYSTSPLNDPNGPGVGSDRVVRGGNWGVMASPCRSAFRNFYTPSHRNNNLGFRCVSECSMQK